VLPAIADGRHDEPARDEACCEMLETEAVISLLGTETVMSQLET